MLQMFVLSKDDDKNFFQIKNSILYHIQFLLNSNIQYHRNVIFKHQIIYIPT